MLSVVKIKREVGGCALKSHGVTSLIMDNQEKIIGLCFRISVGTLSVFNTLCL